MKMVNENKIGKSLDGECQLISDSERQIWERMLVVICACFVFATSVSIVYNIRITGFLFLLFILAVGIYIHLDANPYISGLSFSNELSEDGKTPKCFGWYWPERNENCLHCDTRRQTACMCKQLLDTSNCSRDPVMRK